MIKILRSAIPKLYAHLTEKLRTDEDIQLQFFSWKTLWMALNSDINQGKFSACNLFTTYSLAQETEDNLYTLIFCLESFYALNIHSSRPGKNRESILGVYSWIESVNDLSRLTLKINKDNVYQIDNIFRELFETIFPQDLRHRTGSFYTPVAFAEFLIDKTFLKEDFSLNKKILEPNCGSGAFLVAIYSHVRKHHPYASDKQILDFISNNVVCFDKNPLSVLTTKVVKEWLIFTLDEEFLEQSHCLNVFFADCVNELYYVKCLSEQSLIPSEIDFSIAEKIFRVDINDLNFLINKEFFENIENFVEINESQLRTIYPIYKFINRIYSMDCDVYNLYKEYILKSYSLDYRECFDFILGNPPWINWENLNKDYRIRTQFIWQYLGLFSYKGSKMAFSKEDYSTLITYVVTDYYLKNGGMLGFILPQSLFQSYSNSKGFRCFKIISSNTELKVHQVLDFNKSKIFKGVTIRSSYLVLEKDKKTSYPISYIKNDIKIDKNNILTVIQEESYLAEPSKNSDSSSNWRIFTASNRTLTEISGKSSYRARSGVFTGGANAVYYQHLESFSNGIFVSSNVTERAKRAFPKKQMLLEEEIVYPFIRGRDVEEWYVDYNSSRAIIIPHTMETKMSPIEEKVFKQKYPNTYEYLNDSKTFLNGRGGLTAMDKSNAEIGFYTVLRVGEYTFSDYKVVWRYIHKHYTCAVIEPSSLIDGKIKPCIPQEKLMVIACNSLEEAFYLCGYLSSKQAKYFVESKMVSTQISAHVIDDLYIPLFDSSSPIHQEISSLCKKGHDLKRIDPKASIEPFRNRITELVESLVVLAKK